MINETNAHLLFTSGLSYNQAQTESIIVFWIFCADFVEIFVE